MTWNCTSESSALPAYSASTSALANALPGRARKAWSKLKAHVPSCASDGSSMRAVGSASSCFFSASMLISSISVARFSGSGWYSLGIFTALSSASCVTTTEMPCASTALGSLASAAFSASISLSALSAAIEHVSLPSSARDASSTGRGVGSRSLPVERSDSRSQRATPSSVSLPCLSMPITTNCTSESSGSEVRSAATIALRSSLPGAAE